MKPGISSEQLIAELNIHFPHIATKVELMWSSWELQEYLNQLILPSRTNRQGFPPHIMAILMAISDEHSKLEASHPPKVPKNPKIYTW